MRGTYEQVELDSLKDNQFCYTLYVIMYVCTERVKCDRMSRVSFIAV